MEQPLLYLMIAIVIGGIIGGGTNLLAIKMLFRPYTALYVFNYRLPFTPGVIPNKQGQLAEKIASVVSNYILTPQAISQGLKNTGIQTTIHGSLINQFDKLKHNQEPIGKYLSSLGLKQQTISEYVTSALFRQLIKANNPAFVQGQTQKFIDHFGDIPLNKLLPEALLSSVENNIDKVIPVILKNIANNLEETETKIAIIQMIDQTLEVKNPLLRKLLFTLINDSQLQNQIIKKLQKLIESEAIHNHIEQQLSSHWHKIVSYSLTDLNNKHPEDFAEVLQALNQITHKGLQRSLHSEQLKDTIKEEIERLLIKVWQTRISTFHSLAEPYINNIVDWVVSKVLKHVEENLGELLSQLNIHEIVKQQVSSFPATKLEEMILQVAKKELHYIAYIGVLLGGIMGVIQFLILYNTL
ncbi:DUF445 family protein [Desulfuribacillus alkaliarsenatis]|uniref:DUF445 domain-containing protein n=1 Tax=Desulfuribacillus alkaliarsenatis TaxID=766136 RepID=A0A1E5G4W1_9FIRM|nr:DUF445 family protein [Desulfuribacillus alkaliarsenatis]OEF98217.1 hypothetical protein BHF68_00575 [Desulfuribacillus alkaliarsenatis]